MNNPSMTPPKCVVCQTSPYHGTYFTVLVCRACASFFRRTIAERKVYICARNNDCDIFRDGMRNACRACRLQQCLRSGMKAYPNAGENQGSKDSVQANFSANNQHRLPNPISVPTSFTLNQHSTHKRPIAIPLLEHYRVGLLNFTNGQRSLFSVENPSTIFSEPMYKPLRQGDYLRLNRGTLSLFHTMCINYFEPFNILPHDKKVEILKTYWTVFAFLHKTYLTVAALPYLKKTSQDKSGNSNNGSKHVFDKIVCHYGYYTDKDQTQEYFELMNLDKADCEKAVRFCKHLIDKTLDLMDLYYELNPSEIEFAAIVAIFFWNTVDHLGLLNADMRRERDTVFQELNSILTESLGTVNGAIRLGRIICFMHKLAAKGMEMYESCAVVKLFVPQIQGMWDEDIVPKCFS
ncbi:zinc finger, c4 type (two domains) domain-containing protein [Ditylenchus destructor]|uniref:Zinc finger, c4 type (Two domains) domain-containing protein n=1 Tax=Ditylenchus destructor TaxID=166010 RepID=A0AAD4MRF3_9BILA|nr:zinc finger, c4 type (two domains) domain-containing protein [Ditylenchus destructor]